MWTLALTTMLATLAHAEPTSAPAPSAAPNVAHPATPSTFPESWRGHWKGTSTAAAPGRDGVRFDTELIIDRTDEPSKWTWTIVYDGAAGRQERKYFLVADGDSVKTGRWKIDENNGIVLDASYVAGGLFCRFEVQGNDISVSYRVSGEGEARRLVMELVTTRSEGKDTGKGQAPPVKTYSPISVQRAELRRTVQ